MCGVSLTFTTSGKSHISLIVPPSLPKKAAVKHPLRLAIWWAVAEVADLYCARHNCTHKPPNLSCRLFVNFPSCYVFKFLWTVVRQFNTYLSNGRLFLLSCPSSFSLHQPVSWQNEFAHQKWIWIQYHLYEDRERMLLTVPLPLNHS